MQKAANLNRDLASKWAELVTTLPGSVREQQQVRSNVKDQTDTVAGLAVQQVEKAEQAARRFGALRPWLVTIQVGRVHLPAPE